MKGHHCVKTPEEEMIDIHGIEKDGRSEVRKSYNRRD